MAAFEYRCSDHGTFEALGPIGSAPRALPCPECGGWARRASAVPRLSFAVRARVRAVDATDATSDLPAVVTEMPRGTPPQRGAGASPALRRPSPG